MNKTTEKIMALLERYDSPEDLIEAFLILKGTFTAKLEQKQKEAQEKASKIQSQINLINSN